MLNRFFRAYPISAAAGEGRPFSPRPPAAPITQCSPHSRHATPHRHFFFSGDKSPNPSPNERCCKSSFFSVPSSPMGPQSWCLNRRRPAPGLAFRRKKPSNPWFQVHKPVMYSAPARPSLGGVLHCWPLVGLGVLLPLLKPCLANHVTFARGLFLHRLGGVLPAYSPRVGAPPSPQRFTQCPSAERRELWILPPREAPRLRLPRPIEQLIPSASPRENRSASVAPPTGDSFKMEAALSLYQSLGPYFLCQAADCTSASVPASF